MKKKFSTAWNSSKKPRKQRKYRFNAPLHVKHKLLGSHLAKEIIAKYKKRSLPVVVGDKVRIMRGQHKKREGKVERVDTKKVKVYVTGIDRPKKDGSKSLYPLSPSNLLITELNLKDKKRKEKLEGQKKEAPKAAAKPAPATAPKPAPAAAPKPAQPKAEAKPAPAKPKTEAPAKPAEPAQ